MTDTHGIDPGEAFLREVDEAVRQDQYKALWAKYGNYVAIGLVAAAVAAGGVTLWRESEMKKAAAASSRFQVASDLAAEGKHEDAVIAFEALGKQGGIYGAMARMREATEKVELSDRAAGVKILDDLAADGAAPRDLRDLAALRSIELSLDVMPLEEARRRLTPLASSSAPFHLTARELLAGAEIKAGDTAAAEADLKALRDDPATPPGQRQRAGDLMSTIGTEAAKKP